MAAAALRGELLPEDAAASISDPERPPRIFSDDFGVQPRVRGSENRVRRARAVFAAIRGTKEQNLDLAKTRRQIKVRK